MFPFPCLGIITVIFSTDNEGVFTYMSPRAEAVSGYRPEEVVGRSFTCFLPPEDVQMVGDYFRNSMGGPTQPLECRFITRDGAVRWIRLTAKTIGSEENPEGLRGIISDITERKKAEGQLSISLMEKETLLREIHHRVKNNFQVIISLLRLQLKNIHDPALEAQFNEAAGRIRTMGIVHEILYGSDNLAVIDFNTYIKRITGHIYGTLSLGNRRVALDISAEHINVGIDQAIPCGLLINEIVTNALKHAFPDSFHGDARISVGLSGKDGYITLTVSDNGIGIPETTFEEKNDSLGMSLIPLFVAQLGGVMEVERSKGTGYTITFQNRCGEYENRLKSAGL
ncbi:MAG TPA: PAS domain S-box protein [Spirochaetes bacterium]|nr:PAS domain S-box protein [Spirochaetota bacterium]